MSAFEFVCPPVCAPTRANERKKIVGLSAGLGLRGFVASPWYHVIARASTTHPLRTLTRGRKKLAGAHLTSRGPPPAEEGGCAAQKGGGSPGAGKRPSSHRAGFDSAPPFCSAGRAVVIAFRVDFSTTPPPPPSPSNRVGSSVGCAEACVCSGTWPLSVFHQCPTCLPCVTPSWWDEARRHTCVVTRAAPHGRSAALSLFLLFVCQASRTSPRIASMGAAATLPIRNGGPSKTNVSRGTKKKNARVQFCVTQSERLTFSAVMNKNLHLYTTVSASFLKHTSRAAARLLFPHLSYSPSH